MITKTLQWPDDQYRPTAILHKDELLHFYAIGKSGPYCGRVYVGTAPGDNRPISIAAVASTHAAMALVGPLPTEWNSYGMDNIMTPAGVLSFKDFMKGVKKDTHVFLSFCDGMVHVLRANCSLPKSDDWDRASIEHKFILSGTPVENRNAAYGEASVRHGIASPVSNEITPDKALWTLFDVDQDMTVPVRVKFPCSVLTHLAATADICEGPMAIHFGRIGDSTILAELTGYRGTSWRHVFTEVTEVANVALE